MLEIYNSNQANRALNTYYDFVGNDELGNKELLILTLFAYEGTSSTPYIKRILGADPTSAIDSLCSKGFIRRIKNTGRTNNYEFIYKPQSAEVVSEKAMYVFSNALFNIGKYIKQYKITSWNNLASLVELPLKMNSNGTVDYTLELLSCIGGNKSNKIYNRNKLVKMGVIKKQGTSGEHVYRMNEHAFLLGGIEKELV